MLLEKIKEEDIEFAGLLHDPVAMAENLFVHELNNHDSLMFYDDDDRMEIRLFQLPFLSYEYLIAEDNTKSPTQNFDLLRGAGTGYVFCGRKLGKSLIALIIDLLFDTIHHCKDWTTSVSSIDQDHVDRIIEPHIKVLNNHPFFRLFNANISRKNNNTRVNLDSGHKTLAVNMALSGREPGSAYEGIHANKQIVDESQYETQEIVPKRSQAISERGVIERFAGITAFRRADPAGKIFNNLEKKNWIVNLPQTLSPFWNHQAKLKALDDFSDEGSPAYRIHVLAELVENSEGLYDIHRIREAYYHNKEHLIKHFEITKENFEIFRQRLIVERPKYAKRCWIAADFGVSAPTEIILLFETERPNSSNLFSYIYNITITGLIPDEQTEIFKYLINELKADYVGIDATEHGASQIMKDLGDFYSQDNLIKVKFNEKLVIGYKKNEQGGVEMQNGKPITEEAYVIDWAVEQVRKLFYNNRIEALFDPKLDKQFNAMIGTRRSNRMKYDSTLGNKEDHLHAAFLVFGIMVFLKTDEINTPKFFNWGGSAMGFV